MVINYWLYIYIFPVGTIFIEQQPILLTIIACTLSIIDKNMKCNSKIIRRKICTYLYKPWAIMYNTNNYL